MKNRDNLLDSIMDYSPRTDKIQELESRANHGINSIIHLMDDIDTTFDVETANDLKKRIFLCIKNKDYKKFERALIKLMKEKGK